MSAVKREAQIPLARAPRADVVDAVAAGKPQEEPTPLKAAPPAKEAPVKLAEAAAPAPVVVPAGRRKKRLVTFTNRLDPDLLDWLSAHKDLADTTIAAILDEAVRDYIEKTTGERPAP